MSNAEKITLEIERLEVKQEIIASIESRIKCIEDYDMYYNNEMEIEQWQIDSNERNERKIKVMQEIAEVILKMK